MRATDEEGSRGLPHKRDKHSLGPHHGESRNMEMHGLSPQQAHRLILRASRVH